MPIKIIHSVSASKLAIKHPILIAWIGKSSFVRVRGTNLVYNCASPYIGFDDTMDRWWIIGRDHPNFKQLKVQDPNFIQMGKYLRVDIQWDSYKLANSYSNIEDVLVRIPDINIKNKLVEIFYKEQ